MRKGCRHNKGYFVVGEIVKTNSTNLGNRYVFYVTMHCDKCGESKTVASYGSRHWEFERLEKTRQDMIDWYQ